jgi:hypothetical protein
VGALFLCPEKGGEFVYLKVICAWCGKFLGIKSADVPGIPRLSVTHGICCKCKQKALAEADEALQQNHENDSSVRKEAIYE